MAFDENGQADTLQRKTSICARAYDILVNRIGFPPSGSLGASYGVDAERDITCPSQTS